MITFVFPISYYMSGSDVGSKNNYTLKLIKIFF